MQYAAPTTVDEARSLLADNPGSRVFAGATDVIPQIRAGRPEPEALVDLKGIEQLSQVFCDPDSRGHLARATEEVHQDRFYHVLKALRALLPREQRLLAAAS